MTHFNNHFSGLYCKNLVINDLKTKEESTTSEPLMGLKESANIIITYYDKQIGSFLLCVCLVIDHMTSKSGV